MNFYVDENGLVSSVTILPTDSDSLYSYKLGSKIGDGTDFSLTEERAGAVISMIDNRVPAVIADNPVEENIKEAPKTGSIHVFISLILLIISITTIGVTFIWWRKKGKI